MTIQVPLLDAEGDAKTLTRDRYSRNVARIFIVFFFSIAVREVSFGALFDAYLLQLGGEHGNVLVGSVESIRGLLQMILAYPLGMLADRMPRVRLSRYNIPFFTLGFVLLMCGVCLDRKDLIFAGMCIWAPAMQNWFSSASAIVADSCPPETRTATIASMSNVQLFGSAVGPFIQMIAIVVLNQDHWEMPTLHKTMALGCFMWPVVVVGTYLFEELPPMEKTGAKGRARFGTEELDQAIGGSRLTVRWVLAISLQVATTVTSVGAGMTVKFFPLFFKVDYGFTPKALCILTFIYPLAMAGMQRVCLKASQCLGRLRAIVLFHFLGTACLFLMCYLEEIWLIVPMYILRGALMNAKQPINTAVTMDLITTEMRGRWSSIQSIAGFSWSGSAFIGGWIAQAHGYRFSFFVTALVYTFSGLLYLPLFYIYPKEREQEILQQKCTPSPTSFASPTTPKGCALQDAQVPLLEDESVVLEEKERDDERRDKS